MPDALLAPCGVGSSGAPLSWHCGDLPRLGRRPALLFRSASFAAAICTCASRAPAVDGEGAGPPFRAALPDWPQGGSLAGSSVTELAFPQAPATTAPLGGACVPG